MHATLQDATAYFAWALENTFPGRQEKALKCTVISGYSFRLVRLIHRQGTAIHKQLSLDFFFFFKVEFRLLLQQLCRLTAFTVPLILFGWSTKRLYMVASDDG